MQNSKMRISIAVFFRLDEYQELSSVRCFSIGMLELACQQSLSIFLMGR